MLLQIVEKHGAEYDKGRFKHERSKEKRKGNDRYPDDRVLCGLLRFVHLHELAKVNAGDSITRDRNEQARRAYASKTSEPISRREDLARILQSLRLLEVCLDSVEI